MLEWSLDEARFRVEVFQPLDTGWDPRENYFRCYQLPVETDDIDVIEKALSEVQRHIKRNALGGPHVGASNNLLAGCKEAEETLGNRGKRAEHRKQVLACLQTLQDAVRTELGGIREIPPAAVTAMAARLARRFVRREVEEALAGMGCRIREPVALPAATLPSEWRRIQHGLGYLRFSTLRAYLKDRFPAGTQVDRDGVAAHKAQLNRKASGDALTAETKILVALQRWLSNGELRDVLRAEVIGELTTEAGMGPGPLKTALQAPGMPEYLADLGLPGAEDIGYALLCRVRYPQTAQSNWQSDYQDARASRELRTAYDVLAAQQSLPPDLAKARDELKTSIAEVDRMLAQARQLEGQDVEAAAELYVQAIRLCQDREAEAALRRCYPAEPPRASARVDGEQIRVEWEPSAARVGDITYRVVRRVRSSATGDGSVIAAGTSDLVVTDSAAPAGVPVSYSVSTLRNEEPSTRARSTEAVVVLRSVQNLELLPGDGVVEVRWQLPAEASGARVLRTRENRSGEPAKADAATSRHDRSSFRDTTVTTGVVYQYQVEAEYLLPDGRTEYAAGVVGRIRPQEPPGPVRDLTLQAVQDLVLVSWTPPARGEVQLRLLDTVPDVHCGSVLGLAGVDGLGVSVRAVGPADTGRLRIAVPADGRRHWLLPVTVADEVAVVGNAVEYDSRLPIVTELKAARRGSQVQLTWRWPPRAAEVRVCSKAGNPASSVADPAATVWRLTHADYAQRGCYAAAPHGEGWFSVCVAAYTDGLLVFGPLTSVRVHTRVEARYEILRPSRFRHLNRRRLLVTAAAAELPGVRVVAKPRVPPLDPSDGFEVARFPAPGDGQTSLTGEFELTAKDRPLHLRVFPLQDAEDRVVLVPTHPAQLRVD